MNSGAGLQFMKTASNHLGCLNSINHPQVVYGLNITVCVRVSPFSRKVASPYTGRAAHAEVTCLATWNPLSLWAENILTLENASDAKGWISAFVTMKPCCTQC